ncbi:2OG-Fe(II) oxygenase [Candidatus Pacearchaeota archaeon]|nr:2OG-Fe(II) oxygenase [Candidatus Pacearchaeota archaeon]
MVPHSLSPLLVKKLRAEFAGSIPFRHAFIESFLEEDSAQRLAKELEAELFEEKDSDLFQFRQTQDLHYSKNEVIKDFLTYLESKEFSDFIKGITGIPVKQGAFDVSGSLYIDTDYLLCHDDELEGRKVAYILYLCKDFTEQDGGALALLNEENEKPGEAGKRYYPQWNSLLVFEVSRKSWHEVEEVIGNKKRYAIGGWLH